MSSDTQFRRAEEFHLAPKGVLFVEDNADDFELACIQLSKAKLRNKIIRVSTVDEMLQYLRSMETYLNGEKFPMPAVIVIDQRLPGADGLEAQQMLRTNIRFLHIPIIAISGADQLKQLQTAVNLGADAWMTKPFKGEEFRRIAMELNLALQFDAQPRRPVQILLAENSAEDTLNLKVALRRAKLPVEIRTVPNGGFALDYLSRRSIYRERDANSDPQILITELTLPSMDGLSLIRTVRADPYWSELRIVVLTHQYKRFDIEAAHSVGADTYVLKTPDFERLIEYLGGVIPALMEPVPDLVPVN